MLIRSYELAKKRKLYRVKAIICCCIYVNGDCDETAERKAVRSSLRVWNPKWEI